jgi:hypothetical protein
MKRATAIIFCAAVLASACGTMEEKYQRDMDPVRIDHVDFLADLTTEFFLRTGRLPLSDRLQDKRIVVFVTHRPISRAVLEQAARQPIVLMTTTDLKVDLENGLGRPIDLPSDPQDRPSYGPNFYIYDVNSSRACVAGHLFFDAPGAHLVEGNPRGPGSLNKYYKYERCIRSKAA